MPVKFEYIDLPFGARIWIKTDSTEVDTLLALMKARQEDPTPLFRDIANLMRASFRMNFTMGGRPTPWAPLKEGTAVQKLYANAVYATTRGRRRIRRLEQMDAKGQMRRSVRNILVQSGEYRDSWSRKGARGHVERVSADGVVMGSDHWLAAIHEHGTKPYTIYPKRGKYLRFYGPNGQAVFAREVHHPGLPARPVGIVQEQDAVRISTMTKEWLCPSM